MSSGTPDAVEARMDGWLLLAAGALLTAGFIALASASFELGARDHGDPFFFLTRQGVAALIGLSGAVLAFRIPSRFWERLGLVPMLLAIALLVLVLLPGMGREVNGSTRWLTLGTSISVQVSEPVRLLVLMFVAGYAHRHGAALQRGMGALLKPVVLVAIAAVLLLGQPDFGYAALIMAMSVGVLFVAGARFRDVGALALAGVAAFAALAWTSPYRLARVNTFLDPWADPLNSGWQLTQSLMAIGTGHLSGAGLGAGVQKLFYLPEAHTDFIFAVIAEEAGLLGSLAVLAVFALLVARVLAVARACARRKRMFQAYFALGLALCIGLQVLVNLGVNMGALPTKGLALPLVSYGRSNLVITLVSLGILLRIDRENAALEPGMPSRSRR
ncbi:MAG: putative lipid II flippase FtsW [Gammaproteobacteria bacterium]|nr:putative lipid II flippase FtsW [Gammaproteobacteria bacterium]